MNLPYTSSPGGRRSAVILLLFIGMLPMISCSRSSADQEIMRLRNLFESRRDSYLHILGLEKQVVLETGIWLQVPPEIDPHSATWIQMKKICERWVAVHVGYRWIAQSFAKENYHHPKVRRLHEQILQHLLDRQFRALSFEKLAWKAYRHVLLRRAPSGIPPQIEQLRQRLPEHPAAVDRISSLLAEKSEPIS